MDAIAASGIPICAYDIADAASRPDWVDELAAAASQTMTSCIGRRWAHP